MTLKAKLNQQQNLPLKNHLTKLITRLIQEPDPNLIYHLQNLSLQIKANKKHQKSIHNVIEPSLQTQLRAITGKINLGSQQEPQQAGPCGFIPNMFEQMKSLSQAGVSLSEQDTYLAFKSLTKLSIIKSIKQLRLWGKILCSGKDYYVAQGISQAADEGQLPPDVQPKGTGVNKLAFWAATSLLGQWTQLPNVTPQQVKASRSIKYFFTGDLQRKVITNPHFPGQQKHLLKCQIVRINFSTTLCPKGMLKLAGEEGKEVQPQQGWKCPPLKSLTSLDSWVHQIPNILLNGRTTLKVDVQEGQDQAVVRKIMEAKDPMEPLLKPISQDTTSFNSPGWVLQLKGNNQQSAGMTKELTKINNGIIVLRSQVWRGLTVLFQNSSWQYFYVGQGFKNSLMSFYPRVPQKVLAEPKDRSEFPQPNFPPEQPQQNQPKPADE